MTLLDRMLAMLEARQHECPECANVLPSNRERFHAGSHKSIVVAQTREQLESDSAAKVKLPTKGELPAKDGA